MLKYLGEFILTGIVVITSYLLYFVIMSIATFLVGLPIAFGIKIILDFMTILFGLQPTTIF